LTSFFAIEGYTPLLVLATGISTFIGLWGVGTMILLCVRARLPSPWNQVTAVLLGIQALSLTVQIVGMAEIASRLVLCSIWWALVAVGAATLLLQVRTTLTSPFSTLDRLALVPVAIMGAAIATNVLVAIAPSTKIDELYYHMLIPSRIVSDGALRFYREPWEGAIWPDMLYQISFTPAHAMGYPDAANVVSWGLSVTLLWFAWRVIRANAKPPAWTLLWTGSMCVGIYPVVWNVTGGAHAMGDLAMAAAIVAFCSRERMLITLPPPTYTALLSVLLMSAAASKISLLPLCAALLCLATWPILRSTPASIGRRVAIMLAAPWIIFYCPIALWTWAQSGSPFGPVLAGVFAPSIYPANWAQEAFQSTRAVNQLPLMTVIQYISVGYSPLIWLGVIGAIFATDLTRATRAILGCFFALQCILINWLLPHDARFLGGLHYGLLIAFASFATRDIQDRFASTRFVTTACAMFLLPWLGIQIYYAKQFFPVSLGLEKTAFYERYVAFYADYIKLDKILSKDTVLLVQDFRLDSVYAPRPVFFDRADLPQGRPVALFASPDTVRATIASFGGDKVATLLYENAAAITETYRTPGKPPVIGPLQVVKFITE
jgi:hypothetical protein